MFDIIVGIASCVVAALLLAFVIFTSALLIAAFISIYRDAKSKKSKKGKKKCK